MLTAVVTRRAALAHLGRRCFRGTPRALDVFRDREAAEENIYFKREDQLRIQRLLKKLKIEEEGKLGELKILIEPHELPEEVLLKIIDWKTKV